MIVNESIFNIYMEYVEQGLVVDSLEEYLKFQNWVDQAQEIWETLSDEEVWEDE